MMSHIEMEYAKTLRDLAEAQAEIVRLTKRRDECSNGWDGALASVQRLERELAEVKEQLRLCNIDQFTTAAELAEAREELNDRRKFAYAVEQALDELKGDYIEIIKELRKDAERYRWLRERHENTIMDIYNSIPAMKPELLDAAIDATMKEVK